MKKRFLITYLTSPTWDNPEKNQEALARAIPNIAIASENVAAITHDSRASFSETSKAMETADQIASYAVIIGETAKAIAGLFASSKKILAGDHSSGRPVVVPDLTRITPSTQIAVKANS